MHGASTSISPTAHYTGRVWVENGLSHAELSSREGRLLFESMRPLGKGIRLLGGPTLEAYLLARHRALDALLDRAIEAHGVTQVIEVASGLSPRGWRFTERYGSKLTYVEADLPDMAERKRHALARMGSLSEHHRVEVLDALREDGPGSLAAVTSQLDPTEGLAIITEGLLGYLERDAVLGVWGRFARELGSFRSGRYLSDLHLGSEAGALVNGFRVLLSAFVRGRVHVHFSSATEAISALERAGFEQATVIRAIDVTEPARGRESTDPGARLAHVLDATR